MKPTPNTLVLIHGLWMTPYRWHLFREFYEARGFRVLTPTWPRLPFRSDDSCEAMLGA